MKKRQMVDGIRVSVCAYQGVRSASFPKLFIQLDLRSVGGSHHSLSYCPRAHETKTRERQKETLVVFAIHHHPSPCPTLLPQEGHDVVVLFFLLL